MVWRRKRPAAALPTIALASGTTPRAGMTVNVSNPTNYPAFVQVMIPGTEGYDMAWVEVDAYNPQPSFTLAEQHIGMMVRVVVYELGSDDQPNGNVIASNVIGPVLHAVDPVGTVVSTEAEFIAAVGASASTIVLAAGSVWNGGAFLQRNMSNVRITTPQGNPARIVNAIVSVSTWTNVTLDGLVFYTTAAFAQANRDQVLTTGETTVGYNHISVKQYGDDVLPSVYQAIPPTLLQSPYRMPNTPGADPLLPYTVDGTNGMTFLPQGFSFRRSRNVTIRGCHSRNVYLPYVIGQSTTIRHLRCHGWYFDGMQMISSANATTSDRIDIRDYILSNCYGVYDEIDATSNNSGSGNAPHPDAFQTASSGSGGNPTLSTIDGFINCPGNTRAYAFSSVMTHVIANIRMYRSRYRRVVATGQGSIVWYQPGGDNSVDYAAILPFSGTGGALRYGGSIHQDEARLSRSILRASILQAGWTASGYLVDPASTNAAVGFDTANVPTYVKGPNDRRPATVGELALLMRPQAAHADKNPILPTGHMRPFEPFPVAPTIGATPGATGFDVTLGTVTGAESYELRYRLTGSTGAWTRLVQAGPVFSVTGLTPGSFDVQSFVTTAAGLSGWSDVQAVVVG